ncbi:MAG: RNA-guided endonuclease InsQ/TnpB family protein [Candidatus Hodarchaeota archaeon]
MQLTQKIRIFPTPEQEDVLWHLSKQCRLLYNFALAERREAWKNGVKGITYTKQQNDLPKIKEKYPEYKRVYSKVLQMVLRTLDADYKSFFSLWKKGDRKARPPRFKGRKHFTTMHYNQTGFKVERGKIVLAYFYNNDVPLSFKIPEKYEFDSKVYQVSIYKDGEAFYLSIVHEVSEKPYIDNGLYQSVDLGVSKTVTAVNTHGKFFETTNPRPDKYWNPKVDAIQSRRDHCKKGSRRWKRLNKALKTCKKKCTNQIRDFQHKLSRKMVDNTKANTIIIGDLNVKGMAQSEKTTRGLNRSTQNNGYLSRFARFLTYKAQLVGKKVIEISERNTSKNCFVCGKEHDMPLWKRNMECDCCGNVIDRDRNSAINIMTRFLSQNAMWTGYQRFVDNLRKTGLPQVVVVHSQEAPS